jgi:uncharacterized protein (DUF1499 family)
MFDSKKKGFNMKYTLAIIGLWFVGCMDYQSLGVTNGRLKDCPDYPNCVNSQVSADDKTHYIEPIPYAGNRSEAIEKMKQAILSFDRTEILKSDSTYIHAAFTSKIFRFVDDVEFYADDRSGKIHVRSASRLGMGDHGVNRDRIESLRSVFEKK